MRVRLAHLEMVWAHFVLGLMIAGEAAFIFLGMWFVVPACKRIVFYADTDGHGLYSFMPGAKDFLGLLHLAVYHPAWWVSAFAIAWVLFEWRVKDENKRWLRFSLMVSLALLLFAVIAMFTTLMVIPTIRAAERLNARHPEAVVSSRMATLDRLVGQLEQALVNRDLPAADEFAH